MKRRKGQVWVETVLYTLIGLALIGLVLGFVMPRINAEKDRLVVEQSIQSLAEFDEKINAVLESQGNVRQIDFTMKKGELYINGAEDKIVFKLKGLDEAYSEPGAEIFIGIVSIKTNEEQKGYSVELTLDYDSELDLQYMETEVEKKFTQASTPYRFSITNKELSGGLFVVSIEEAS